MVDSCILKREFENTGELIFRLEVNRYEKVEIFELNNRYLVVSQRYEDVYSRIHENLSYLQYLLQSRNYDVTLNKTDRKVSDIFSQISE